MKRFMKNVLLFPLSILMGNMSSSARMLKESEEADNLLSGDGDTAATDGTKPDEAGLAASQVPETKKDETPAQSNEPSVAELQAEVARLTRLIEDENSPTVKQKYATLQGMFNAETARLKEQVAELKESLKAKPEPTPEPAKSAMSDEDYAVMVEEVGEKAAKIYRKAVDAKADQSPEIATLKAEIAALKGETKAVNEKAGQLEVAQSQTAEGQFFASLDKVAPDWKKINGWTEDGIAQDARFTVFMHNVIPGTSSTYQDALNAHYSKRNVAKVAEIFDIFKKSVGIAEAAAPEKKSAAADLEQFIEPDKTGKGSQVPDSGKDEIVSKAEYEKFVESVKRGTFRGTREERAKLEARYDKAFMENRIR